jgi:predicted TIM-barrel fold metal-dependent hydrolase
MISADSHIVEPADLWVRGVAPEFRDRVPRIDSRPDADYLVIEGMRDWRVSGAEGAMATTKLAGEDITAAKVYRYRDERSGAWDPVARLADQDIDQIRAEVIYPGWLIVFSMPDITLRTACMRAYNNWIAEFCAVAPDRLIGAAQLPLARGHIDLAIAEARRAKDLGLRALMLPQIPELPYDQPEYVPLWEALSELDLPLSIHISTGNNPVFTNLSGSSANTIAVSKSKTGVAAAAIELLWGAVPARYPKLRFVMTEGGIGWIAFTLRFLDHWWEDHHLRLEPHLDEPPSAYFHRQFWATFEDDRPGILTLPLLNAEHLMWSNDYPHTEGTWPNSVRRIEQDLGDLPEDVRRKLIHDNAAAFYGLPSPLPLGAGYPLAGRGEGAPPESGDAPSP